MKKAISYMACSMAAMLALSACGSAASSASTVASSSDAASTESTAASEASNEPVTITFAQYSGSGDNEQYLQQMVDNYMKENPNVTIDLQTYGYDDYFTQMTAKVSGGQAPDVFELDYQNFVSYAKKGALMPLDDILTKDGIDTSIYNDMALKAFSADGVQYGVPDSFSNVVLIYNKDLFDQAGIDYPTDDWKWEDAMAAAEKIRALGDNIFGYYHPISFNEFYKTVKQNGGSLFNDDFTEFTMDTPENIETLQYMVDMQQKTNVMPTEEQMAGMGDWDLFESGRLVVIHLTFINKRGIIWDSGFFQCLLVAAEPFLYDTVFFDLTAEKSNFFMPISNHMIGSQITSIGIINSYAMVIVIVTVAVNQYNGDLCFLHLTVKVIRVHTDNNNSVKVSLFSQSQVAFIYICGRNNHMIAMLSCVILNAANDFTVKIILQHQFAAGLGLWNDNSNQL